MNKFKIFLLTLLFAAMYIAPAYAKVETMTVSELKPGMKGIGRTVISGTKVEEFDIEILGVLQKGGFAGGPMILVKCSGDVIEATGGIAGGYSGSPIYVNGKMVGALAAAWYFADHSVGGVTPIHEMLKNFNFPDEAVGELKVARLDKPVEVYGRTIDSAILSMDREKSVELESSLEKNTMVLTACKTPLFINGINPELVNLLKEKLGPQLPYMEIMSGTGTPMASHAPGVSINEGPTVIEPGSALGMQLVTGDIDMTAIGTVTWVDPDDPEKRLLAFGHPFLSKGRVEAPLTSARIIFTMPALDRSFKIGEPIEIIGVSHQDRANAVSGYLGRTPDLVDINFKITDLDQNRTQRYSFGVLPDEDLLPMLAMLPMMQGMTQTVDRTGPATASVSYSIKGEGLAEPIERHNMYFSTMGGFDVMNEPLEVLSMLTSSNIFREVKVSEIDIEVEITENRQTLDLVEIEFIDDVKIPANDETSVELSADSHVDMASDAQNLIGNLQDVPQQDKKSATPPRTIPPAKMPPGEEIKSFAPGDTIRVKAMIKPYRQEIYEEILEIKIPKEIPTGMTQLEIRGGGGFGNQFMMGGGSFMMMIPDGILPMQFMPGISPEKPPKTLDELIEKFLERDHNNELIIELIRPPETNPEKIKKQKDDEKPDLIKSITQTDKVIYGTFQLPLEIKKPEDESATGSGEDSKIESGTSEDTKKKDKPEAGKSWKSGYRGQ
ncbi:hypothetical protein KKB99_05535 [bacterium]|nr:hypothetical protein [bacterium]MBU1025458.1 hypothetical protein [bacterium]